MVLGNFQCRWLLVEQGPTVLSVGAVGLFAYFIFPFVLLFLCSFSLS